MTRFSSRNMTYLLVKHAQSVYSTGTTHHDRSGEVILSRKPNLTAYMTIKFLEKIIPHKLCQESRDSTHSHASGCKGDWFKIGYEKKITHPLYITPNTIRKQCDFRVRNTKCAKSNLNPSVNTPVSYAKPSLENIWWSFVKSKSSKQ